MHKKCPTINIIDDAQAKEIGLLQDELKKGGARKLVNTSKSAAGPKYTARKNLNVAQGKAITSCMKHYDHALEK